MIGPRGEYRRNLGAQALGRLLYVGGGAAVFVAATHAMSLGALGQYALALALLAVVWSIADLGTSVALGTLLGGRKPSEQGELLGALILLRLPLGLAAGAAGAALAWLALDPAVRGMTALACIMAPLLAARFYEPVFQVAGRPEGAARLGIIHLAVLLLAAVPVLLLAPARADLLLAAHLAAALAQSLAGFLMARRLLPLCFRGGLRRLGGLLRVVAPLGVSSLIFTVNLRVGVFLLGLMMGPAAVAVFVGAQRFLELGLALASTMITPLFPIFSRLQREGDSGAPARQAVALALAIGLPAAILAPRLAAPVVGLLYGPELDGAVALLPVMALQFGVATAGVAAMPALVAAGRFHAILGGGVAGLAAHALLCPPLILWAGPLGAAWAALGAEMVGVALPLLVLSRSIGRLVEPRVAAWLLVAGGAAALVAHAPLGAPAWVAAGLSVTVFGAAVLASGLLAPLRGASGRG